jgi:hypothetical protein
MNESPMIAALIAFTLISVVSLNIVYAQQAFPSSTVQLRKTASGMMTTPTPSSSTPPQPER